MSLCTRVLVLAEGKVLAEGPPRGGPQRSESHRGLSWTADARSSRSTASRRLRQDDDPQRHDLRRQPGRHHHRDRPERGRQVDGVQDGFRASSGAQRNGALRRRRRDELDAAPAARGRHLLRAPGPQHLLRAFGARQSSSSAASPRAPKSATCRPASRRRSTAFRCCGARPTVRPGPFREASRSSSRSSAGCCSIRS